MNLVDTGFVLVCSALVFLMTPGLAFFYGGWSAATTRLPSWRRT